MQKLFNIEVDVETKIMQQNCIALFESGIENNQRLAFQMARNIGLSKSEMLWNYILKRWNKSDIMKRWGEHYAESTELFIMFSFDFLGKTYLVVDGLEDVTINEGKGNYNPIYHLATWEDYDMSQMYNRIFKAFKKYILNVIFNN